MTLEEEPIIEEGSESLKSLGLKTARRGSIFVSGKLVNAVVALAILVYLARALRPVDYGLYTIVMAYSLVLGMGGNFGMGTAFRKMVPERIGNTELVRKLVSNGIFVSAGVALVISIAGIAASPYIASNIYHNPSITIPLMIAAASIVLSVLFNASVSALVGMHRAWESTVANLFYSISQLALIILLVSMGYGILGAMSAYAVSIIIGSAVSFAYLAKYLGAKIEKAERKIISEITRFSMPVVASNVAMLGIMNFAPMLLGIYVGAAVVGNYGIALRGSRFIDLLITSITFILLPAFSTMLASREMREKAERAINSSIYYTFLLLLPLIAYMIGSAYPLIFLLFSKSYSTAPVYISIALAGLAIEVIWSISSTLVIGHGNTKRFMQYQLSIVAIELASLIVLTPIYKAYGALVAVFIIAPVVAVLLYMRLLRKEFAIRVSLHKPARLALAALIIALVSAYLSFAMHQSKYALVTNLIIVLLAYPALASWFGAVDKATLEFIGESAKGLGMLGKAISAYLAYFRVFAKPSRA